MQPWIRKYQYIADYYHSVYKLYTEVYQGFPVTYYSLDFKNSVLDKEQLLDGSYAKFGVGDLSGAKWKKIIFLPVYGIETIQPNYNATERGLTLHESEVSQISFPNTYGIKPTAWDVVHFHQDYMMERVHDISPIFVVNNVNLATFGETTHYQCKLKVAPFKRSDIEKQIDSYWAFLEFTKRIHRVDTASLLLKFQKRTGSLTERLKTSFNSQMGFYLLEV